MTTTRKAIRRSLICMVVLSSVAYAGMPVLGEEQPTATLTIQPDDAHQAAIADLSRATSAAAFRIAMQRLTDMGEPDRKQLVSQLLWYAVLHRENTRTPALIGRVLKQIDASKEVIVTALVPHLDNTDATIRAVVKVLLHGYEDASAERPPDFSTYRSILEADFRAGREPRASLVRFMYETDPGTGLRTMVRAMGLRRPEEIKPILWGEHVVAELFWKRRFGFIERSGVDPAAVRELDKLARNPAWWVRLYCACVLKGNSELATHEMLGRLTADPHPVVKEVARS